MTIYIAAVIHMKSVYKLYINTLCGEGVTSTEAVTEIGGLVRSTHHMNNIEVTMIGQSDVINQIPRRIKKTTTINKQTT